MYKNILLPIDLSEESSWRKALPIAIEHCRAFGPSSLHVLTVVPSLMTGATAYLPEDAGRKLMEGATTALAFIVTLDPAASFAQTNFVPIDLNSVGPTWDRYSAMLELTDPLLEGQILQVGFRNTASNFEGSGIFYDNVEARLSDGE